MRASIVVFRSRGVSRHTGRWLGEALASGAQEVIFVGGGSEDVPDLGGAARVLPEEPSAPAARNRGAASAAASWILFLDGDVQPAPGALDALSLEAGRPGGSALAGLLLYPDRSVSGAGVAFTPDAEPVPLYRGFPEGHAVLHRRRDLQAATAAFLLVRRDSFEAVGGFDGAFGDGFADLDLCLRLREKGAGLRLCPTAVATTARTDGPWEVRSGDGARFRQAWRGRAAADDLDHYRRDGLLRFDYREGFPPRLEVAPELARLSGHERESEAERLLGERARQFAASLEDRLALEAEIDRLRRSAIDPAAAPSAAAAHVRVTTVHEGLRRARARVSTGRVISIVLGVRDAATALRRSLPKLLEQEGEDPVEVVAFDRGSKDDTREVLRHHGATVLAASSGELDAGTARHLAARHAKGDVVVTVEPTTEPEDGRWLAALVSALDRDPDLAAVTSAVRFDAGEDPLARRDVERAAPTPLLTAAFDLAARAAAARGVPEDVIRFHLCGTAFRSTVLTRVPLSPLPAWAGPAWAREAWLAGRRFTTEPAAAVEEPVPRALVALLLGGIDIGSSARSLFRGTFATADVLPGVFEGVHDDWEWLRTRSGLVGPALESWRVWAALRRVATIVGYWMGANAAGLPVGLVESVSRAVLAGDPPEAFADVLRFV